MQKLLEEVVEEFLLEGQYGVKKRVRQGGEKIQRRFKFSKNKNRSYNNRTKKTTVLTSADRQKMSIAQKKAAKKRMSGKALAGVKRKRSNNKRKALGFDK